MDAKKTPIRYCNKGQVQLKECFTELQVSTTHPFRVFT